MILFLTASGKESGPRQGMRPWYTLRWPGREWERRPFAPTDPGPQPWTTGGEMVLWSSRDQGAHWVRVRPLTRASRFNHTYARRPVHAHPDFYAFWADGHTLAPSESRLYFTNRAGDAVWRLPERMSAEFQKPERLPSK